jgi:hypothetical protein
MRFGINDNPSFADLAAQAAGIDAGATAAGLDLVEARRRWRLVPWATSASSNSPA